MAQWFRLLRFCGMMALLITPALALSATGWQGLLAPAGSLRLERGGREFGTLEPGLHESGWRGASLSPARLGAEAGETMRGEIRAPGGTRVAAELLARPVEDGMRLLYRLTPGQDASLNSLHVALVVPVSLLSGGSYEVDGQKAVFPVQFKNVGLFSGPVRSLILTLRDQGSLRMAFTEPTPVLVQDDRQWGPTFTVRIGPQMGEAALWPAGKTLEIDLTLTSPEGMSIEYDSPLTLAAGKDWLPLNTRLEIIPGSALDFSKLFAWHAPAGRLGRIIGDTKGRLVFEKRPKEAARFYGFNLCFSAQYLSHVQSDRLAARLRRLGYNAVRFHHYESELVDRSQETST
ncbi:MAG: hypothetical protein IT210_13175, partial [Armatimonadetes bacterium]|nr:hypothetical protein [Armatimonadota bacterium]